MTAMYLPTEEPLSTRISFDGCVDWLLSLYADTSNRELKTMIVEVLGELRAIGPVEGTFEDVVLGALASVESAFEIAAAAA